MIETAEPAESALLESRPPMIRAWMRAIRVQTLPAAVVPVLVGYAVATAVRPGKIPLLVATLVAATLIQIGTNLANDYFDFRKGADTADRVGPPRITASVSDPRVTLRAALAAFGMSAAIGVYLIVVGGWPILVIGVVSIAAGIAYTGGPFPLAYHGLGEVFTFIFFGIVAVTGTTYLQVGQFTRDSLLASLPAAFLVTAILVVNNLRDIDTDRAAGKRTLATRLGPTGTRLEYSVLVLGAFAFPFLYVIDGVAQQAFWLPLLCFPFAVGIVLRVWATNEARGLIQCLIGTARLHLVFGVLLALTLMR